MFAEVNNCFCDLWFQTTFPFLLLRSSSITQNVRERIYCIHAVCFLATPFQEIPMVIWIWMAFLLTDKSRRTVFHNVTLYESPIIFMEDYFPCFLFVVKVFHHVALYESPLRGAAWCKNWAGGHSYLCIDVLYSLPSAAALEQQQIRPVKAYLHILCLNNNTISDGSTLVLIWEDGKGRPWQKLWPPFQAAPHWWLRCRQDLHHIQVFWEMAVAHLGTWVLSVIMWK